MENYRIESTLGEGIFSKVYLVSDLRDGTFHALKVLKENTDKSSKLFMREIRALQKIRGICVPHLLCYESAFVDGGDLNILTNYVVGYNLKELNPFIIDKQFAENFLSQLLSVLEKLQNERIAHRDIKPTNIIYNPITKTFTIIDFGLSVMKESKEYAGSKSFFSPTLLRKHDSVKSIRDLLQADIFALGVTLFVVLNGFYPKEGSWIWNESSEVVKTVNLMLEDKYTALEVKLQGSLTPEVKLQVHRS